ncbi:unnamed protein product [Oncorhynchus mykiss]|uniref:60S ribosomal export protein NMD3 OB-fold domain-containing protein n=1 Tax=Oncorhynchus mykiss TaxID=8022 RepID=A0A060Z4Z3_ONCMY|nr:unnamed protein product [Oncorhynchus mykiss]
MFLISVQRKDIFAPVSTPASGQNNDPCEPNHSTARGSEVQINQFILRVHTSMCKKFWVKIETLDYKHLILFLSVAEVDGGTYWRNPFNSLVSPRQLEEFIVMDTDIIRNQKLGAGAGIRSNKHTLAEVWVQKTSEMDTAQQYHCRTHLGHLLNIGDLVQGFDFANSNVNDEFLNKMNPSHIPDVVRTSTYYCVDTLMYPSKQGSPTGRL